MAAAIGLSGQDFATLYARFFRSDHRTTGNERYTSSGLDSDHSPYNVLGLEYTASLEEIKKQYRSLSKQFHPDVTQHLSKEQQQKTEIKMREINHAYGRIKELRNFK